MLEFYQAYTDYQGVMDLTQEIITRAAKDVTGGTKTKWGAAEIDWANWRRMTMREAIIHYWPEAAGTKPEMSEFADAEGVKGLVQRFNAGMCIWHTTRTSRPERRLQHCSRQWRRSI